MVGVTGGFNGTAWKRRVGVPRWFPHYEFSSIDIIAGDQIVMEEWRMTGTHEGGYLGIPPTDNEIEFQAMGKYVIEYGKIAEEYGYFDPQEFLAQLED